MEGGEEGKERRGKEGEVGSYFFICYLPIR